VAMSRFRARLLLDALESRTVPATYTVTNTNDNGGGSLRQAIADADSNPGADTVTFDQAGVFANPQTIILTSGSLLINDAPTTIAGPAAKLTIDGNKAGRVFYIDVSSKSLQPISISDLTLADGSVPYLQGGGAMFNKDEALSVTRCTISG